MEVQTIVKAQECFPFSLESSRILGFGGKLFLLKADEINSNRAIELWFYSASFF